MAFNSFIGLEKIFARSINVPLPEQRIKVSALLPGVVANAAMGASSP
jgi:hypothetical protein